MSEKNLIEGDVIILSGKESEMQSLETMTQPRVTDDAERQQALLEALERLLNQIFGCSHRHLSRTFRRNNKTYRVCMSCGMKRNV